MAGKSKLRSELFSPRRITIAVVIALAMSGGAVGLVGLASASDEPELFPLPERMAGDRFEYASFVNGERQSDDGDDSVYEQLPLQPWKDQNGSWIVADAIERTLEIEAMGEEYQFRFWSMLESGTSIPIAASSGGAIAASSSAGLFGSERADTNTMPLVWGREGGLCGMVNSLQGASAGGQTVTTPSACMLGPGPTILEFQARATWKDLPALTYSKSQENVTVTVTFAEGIAYPVRVQSSVDSHVFDMELIGLERGSAPLSAPTSPGQGSAGIPPVHLAPVDRYGPDWGETGIAYPLRQAIQEALDDPAFDDLRDFMDRNPDWYLHSAAYDADEERDHQRWILGIVAPGEAMEVWLSRTANALHPAVSLIPGQEDSALAWDHFRWKTGAGNFLELYAQPRDELPTFMPRVADVAAAWQSYSEDTSPPAHLGFQMPYCYGNGCTEATVRAGVHGTTTSSSSSLEGSLTRLFDPAFEATEEGFTVVFNSTADFTELWLVEKTEQRSIGPLATPQPEAAPEERGDEAPMVVAGLQWTPPSEGAVAGLGIASLFAALAYYLWPLVKATPLAGLWIRQRPEPLDHPVRRDLFRIVSSEPGLHYQGIVRLSGRSKSVVEHHLRQLTQKGLVTAVSKGGYTCYFPSRGTDRRVMAAAGSTRSVGAQEILEAVTRNPGTNVTEVARQTGLSPGTVSHHLRRLRESGAIIAERDGRSVRLRAAAWIA